MRLKDKVALITGAGMGIGRATCLLFAREGARIVALDINDEAGAKTVDLVKEEGGEAIFVHCDVASEEQVRQAIDAGVSAFGRLNILCNNAAIWWGDKDVEVTRTTEELLDRVMAVNFKGAVWVCKHGIPELIKQGGGTIVNISSPASYQSYIPVSTAYACSKGAMNVLAHSIAIFYADKGIRCNTIQPGAIDTPMTEHWDDETRKELAAAIPLGRLGRPEDAPNAALFLASDEASYITGTEIFCEGGLVVKVGIPSRPIPK